mmetsp:Transcript_16132/g.28172  ORF Transcript_16132/g.28172 Transcript_16132/m.28172 type:complete len:247 (+) Transcript_16132:13-753(+)
MSKTSTTATLLLTLLWARAVSSFVVVPGHSPGSISVGDSGSLFPLFSKKSADEAVMSTNALPVGTFVEFEEKKRVHVGKISQQEHKSNGGARYVVVDDEGHQFNIADKAVHFSMNPPNSPNAADKLFGEFCEAQKATEEDIQKELEISPELLELAWEEALESAEMDGATATLTPSNLVELVHSHAASQIEKYKAWKFLQSSLAHVFFKEIKDHGRIASFKAKARKAVDAAKQAFCNDHEDSDLCLV